MGTSNMKNINLKAQYIRIQRTPNTCQYNCNLKILAKYQGITIRYALKIII